MQKRKRAAWIGKNEAAKRANTHRASEREEQNNRADRTFTSPQSSEGAANAFRCLILRATSRAFADQETCVATIIGVGGNEGGQTANAKEQASESTSTWALPASELS